MHSYKSDYGQRRPYSSRESRPWDEEAKTEEWPEPHENSKQDPYDNYTEYSEDEHSRTEELVSRGHSKMYIREHTSDTDWRRRHTVSSERVEHRYRPESADSYRQNIKQTMSLTEGYQKASRNRTPEESSRYGHRQEEFYSQYKEESHYRSATEYYKDRDSRERSWSQERTHSQEVFEKRSGSFARDHDDPNHSRTMFLQNGSSRQTDLGNRCSSPPPIPPPPVTGEKKMSKGFQRFLDVLNMGVNVETLTKIVNQGSPDVRNPSPPSPQWTTEPAQRPQYCWPETERNAKPPFSPHSRSYSSNGKIMSEEKCVESHQFERKFPENRSVSPPLKNSNFEDDNKQKQMHDVLQAIGIKLEFEELGQMSNRIQERLYGKKQNEHGPIQKEESVRARRKSTYVPKCRSRSSSESSSESFKDCKKSRTDAYSSQKEETDFSHYTDTCSTQQSTTNVQIGPPASYVTPKPEVPPAALIPPPYTPPGNYTTFPPNFPPGFFPQMPQYPSSYPPPPPPLPPPPPPSLPPPPFPPHNMFPPFVPPNAPAPQHTMPHPFLPNVLIPRKHPPMDSNVHKAKRPRCLQVISTKK